MTSHETRSQRSTRAQMLAPSGRQAKPVEPALMEWAREATMKERLHTLSRGIAVIEWVRENQEPHEQMDDILLVLDTTIRTCQEIWAGMRDHA